MNTDFPDAPPDDDVARAMRSALARTVAESSASSSAGDWTVIAARGRRTQLRRRTLAGSLGVAVALGFVFAIAGITGTTHRGVTVLDGETTTTASTVAPGAAPADALEFREVLGTIPYGSASSSSSSLTPSPLSTPPASTCNGGQDVTPATPGKDVVLPDRAKTVCYILGPTLMNGAHVTSADVTVDRSSGVWMVTVSFDNNDFVIKVASPYVNKQVAIVVDGFVESAPTINPGIAGPDITISGSFDEATAHRIATEIAPKVTVSPGG